MFRTMEYTRIMHVWITHFAIHTINWKHFIWLIVTYEMFRTRDLKNKFVNSSSCMSRREAIQLCQGSPQRHTNALRTKISTGIPVDTIVHSVFSRRQLSHFILEYEMVISYLSTKWLTRKSHKLNVLFNLWNASSAWRMWSFSEGRGKVSRSLQKKIAVLTSLCMLELRKVGITNDIYLFIISYSF